jgi:type IV secretory pathway VirB10-like protein
MALLKFLHI